MELAGLFEQIQSGCIVGHIRNTIMKSRIKLVVILSLVCFSFKSTNRIVEFDIKGPAKSKKYGYTKQDPIKVGGGTTAGYHFMFMGHLRGTNGEKLEVERIGSCGSYPNPDPTLTPFDEGVLTCFSINCPSFKEPRILYLDKYRTGDLYIPTDCTWAE